MHEGESGAPRSQALRERRGQALLTSALPHYSALTGLGSLGGVFPRRCPGLAQVAPLGLESDASTARIRRYE